MALVDEQAYAIFGLPQPAKGAQQGSLQSAEYTAGTTSIVLELFSPISPQNYVRQSLPFSYLTVSVSGRDGASPDVALYSDIDNSWAGKYDRDASTRWDWALTPVKGHVFTIGIGDGRQFNEVNDRAQWGQGAYREPDFLGGQSCHRTERLQCPIRSRGESYRSPAEKSPDWQKQMH